jgi:group I intron endonuclease
MIGIYKIINPNGKVYIGQSIRLQYRKNQYKNLNIPQQPRIYNSIKKYGWENHIHDVIEECSVEQLNERETYWKQYYLDQMGGDWDMVLFCNLYDNGGGPLSESTKKKMSIARTGYKDSEETKLKKSNSFKGRKGTDKQKKAVSDWWATNPERSLEYCIELGKKKLINSKLLHARRLSVHSWSIKAFKTMTWSFSIRRIILYKLSANLTCIPPGGLNCLL